MIGTVTALIIAMSFGFRAVFVAGALCYLLALAAVAMGRKSFVTTTWPA